MREPGTWIDLPPLFDLSDPILAALMHGFREAGVEHELQAVTTHVGSTRGDHRHALRVRAEHAETAARLILALLPADGANPDVPDECPACGARTRRERRCPGCDLNFLAPRDPEDLLSFARELLGRGPG